MQCEDNRWVDPIFWELADDLGVARQTSVPSQPAQPVAQPVCSPPDVQSNISLNVVAENGYQNTNLLATGGSLPHHVGGLSAALATAASLPAHFGSPHENNFNLVGVNSVHNLTNYGSFRSSSLLHAQPMLFDQKAFPMAPAAGAVALARPSGSHSPSSSSGCQAGDDHYIDNMEQCRAKKPLNKGALAQKRFRERQKERMRANEAQVADLTARLEAMQLEKERLESRARLLEQVVSLNLTHEAKLHTNKEIMVREQEILLEELADFVLELDPTAAAQAPAPAPVEDGLQALLQQLDGQHTMHQQQQRQQQQQHGEGNMAAPSVSPMSEQIRSWTVSTMTDQVFPRYISRLQQLLHRVRSAGSSSSSSTDLAAAQAAAAAADQEVRQLVLRRREMIDRHALFSHYYWAMWCLNRSEMAATCPPAPPADVWQSVLQQLQLTPEQHRAVVAARKSLLLELRRVADEWQKALPTLALQLLQVPRDQWHTVAAVQSMVCNLAAEREAVVAFLHNIVDEVLTPQQEGCLEASSYPWCPDVWAIATAAADSLTANRTNSGDSVSSKGNKSRKEYKNSSSAGGGAAGNVLDDDPLAALAMGTDVLQPLMPFMTAFQLLRTPVTARGAGLRLKRALLLDPFRTVVPAAAFRQPSAAEVLNMSLLDAHCGAFQQVMLWDWLKTNLPGYITLPGLNPADSTARHSTSSPAAALQAAAPTATPTAVMGSMYDVGGAAAGIIGPVGVC